MLMSTRQNKYAHDACDVMCRTNVSLLVHVIYISSFSSIIGMKWKPVMNFTHTNNIYFTVGLKQVMFSIAH